MSGPYLTQDLRWLEDGMPALSQALVDGLSTGSAFNTALASAVAATGAFQTAAVAAVEAALAASSSTLDLGAGISLNGKTANRLTFVTGVPTGGASGDIAIRLDAPGTSDETIYQNQAGTWVGIL